MTTRPNEASKVLNEPFLRFPPGFRRKGRGRGACGDATPTLFGGVNPNRCHFVSRLGHEVRLEVAEPSRKHGFGWEWGYPSPMELDRSANCPTIHRSNIGKPYERNPHRCEVANQREGGVAFSIARFVVEALQPGLENPNQLILTSDESGIKGILPLKEIINFWGLLCLVGPSG